MASDANQKAGYVPENSAENIASDEIVQDQDTANAKAPNKPDEALNVRNGTDQGIVVNASDMPDSPSASKKKKKRSRKPASKRGLGKPTGFEEFHADAPLTPGQYAESRKIFDPEIPFVDRILRAIQRFERTRKMSSERRDVFYKYLIYGGVDVSPNMFVGAQDTGNMDKDQLSTTMAQANISEDMKQTIVDPKNDTSSTDANDAASKLHSPEHLAKFVVDFESTMRGFLSRYVSTVVAFDTQDEVSLVTTTLERFMDYLLQHDVCPEYAPEVLQTRNLCRKAQTELWHCAQAERLLPGDFNIACSTLFGGNYGENYDGETYWGPSDTKGNVFVGLKPEQATQIVGFAIAGAASEDVYLKYLEITTGESGGRDFEVVKIIEDHGFEITKIEQPTQECRSLYKENTTEFRPVGKIFAKFFPNPDAPPEDLTHAERVKANDSNGVIKHPEEFIFFIESKPLLSLLRPGMRIEATIHELNCGVWFFDQVIRVLPSFDLWLENELMIGWKEPRPVAGVPDLKWNIGQKLEVVDEVDNAEADEPGYQAATVEDGIASADISEGVDHNPIARQGDEHPY